MALVLSMGLIFGMVDTTIFAANTNSGSEGVATESKVSDPCTMSGWKEYFRADSTEFAGTVWSDKSVFTDTGSFQSALRAENSSYRASISMQDEANNFLVALSTMASNKEVVGYSTTPTDTIFVLDVSQSMDISESIASVVNSANAAIKELLNLNKNNRIGVVLYSGNPERKASETSTATTLLELGRYSAGNGGTYLSYEQKTDTDKNSQAKIDTTISITKNVKKEGENKALDEASKRTNGGTYMQNGLYKAYEMFKNVKDTTVQTDGNNVQEGTKRMPILVLMSDGAPTAATTSYNNVGTSNIGNGGSTGTEYGFANQLTAAWLRSKVEAHYDRSMRFYTLGLNLVETISGAQDTAKSVLNPKDSTAAIKTCWSNFIKNGKASVTRDGTTYTFTDKKDGVTFTSDSKYYVDQYFSASGNDQLTQAFKAIVDSIILQSAYYPTLVDGGSYNMDGYVSFDDRIGMFMEVKNITGLMLGDTVYSGATLASMMKDGSFGSAGNYTDLGNELVRAVASRIGVSETQAIAILQNAWRDGQIAYNSANDYSNYIGWYENANGTYIGNWMRDHDEKDIDAMVAAGAKYITKSYGFYGAGEGGLAKSNMMYVVVKVRQDITTGNQTVIFQVPASLIPKVTYQITLDTNSMETATKITMKVNSDAPLRLLYEVGVRSDINELNVNEVYEELQENPIAGLHMNKNEDGTYTFYTNNWAHQNGVEGIDPTLHETTEAWFEPSVENERYYYVSNSTLYTLSQDKYTAYTGTSKPTESGKYYYPRVIFKGTGSNVQRELKYVPVAQTTLQYGQKDKDGKWYIPKGQIYRELDRFVQRGAKSENRTGTLGYYLYPLLVQPTTAGDDYDIYKFLGNNGKVTMNPATGIKLTKEVDDTITNTSASYKFTVTVSENSGSYRLHRLNTTTGKYEYTVQNYTNGTFDVSLKAGETVYLTNLPTGAYTVKEAESDSYKVSSVVVNKVAQTDLFAAGEITQYNLNDVTFTNTEKLDGSLIVRKTVEHTLSPEPESFATKEFTAVIELKDKKDNLLANKTFTDGAGHSYHSDRNGKITVTLKRDESIKMIDLPEGTTYTVTETNIPTGFSLQTNAEALTGQITEGGEAIVTLVNKYQPGGVPKDGTIKISMIKKVEGGRTWEEGDSFSFHLEKMDDHGNWTKVGESKTVSYATKDIPIEFDLGQLTEIGTHTYRVVEENTQLAGITSDTYRMFMIEVTDADGDGYLEIARITGTDITFTQETNTVSMTFTNTYATTGSAAVIIPVHKYMNNNTGVDVSLAGYTFALKGTSDMEPVVADVTTDESGEAEFHLEITGSQFDELLTKQNLEAQAAMAQAAQANEPAAPENEPAAQANEPAAPENEPADPANEPADLANEPAAQANEPEDQANEPAAPTNEPTAQAVSLALANEPATQDIPVAGAGATNPLPTLNEVVLEYELTEKTGTVPGVTYSTEKYLVEIVLEKETVDTNVNVKVKSVTITKEGQEGTVDINKLSFTNSFALTGATSVKFPVSPVKKLEGREVPLKDQEFTFALYETGADFKSAGDPKVTAKNNGSGIVDFGAIAYTQVGTYHYIIQEVNASRAISGISYSNELYYVTVEIGVDANQNMTVKNTSIIKPGSGVITSEQVTFTNHYKADSTGIVLGGIKTLNTGKVYKNLEHGMFAFNLLDENGRVIDTAGNVTTSEQTNTAVFSFKELTYDTVGVYNYKITEAIPANKIAGVTYDSSVYDVTVTVTDNGEGSLSAAAVYKKGELAVNIPEFVNSYTATPIAVTLSGTKDLEGRTLKADEFQFLLYGANENFEQGNLVSSAKNAADGTVTFDTLTFDETGIYYYIIKEDLSEKQLNVAYDISEYQVAIHVYDVGGRLAAKNITYTLNGTNVEKWSFTNTYTAPDPFTLNLAATKTLQGRTMTAEEFSFNLYETDASYDTTGKEPIQTKTNQELGQILFDEMTFEEAKTHYYVLKEQIPEIKNGITYDTTEYQIQVTVSDEGKGYLKGAISINGEDQTDADQAQGIAQVLTFANVYTTEKAAVTFGGKKTLEGRDLTEKEFAFGLFEANESYEVDAETEPLEKVENAADGTYRFTTLEFEEAGTKYYVVKELAGTDENVAYDETVYQIKVEVTDNGKGQMVAKITYGEKEVAQAVAAVIGDLNFTNIYSEPTPTPTEPEDPPKKDTPTPTPTEPENPPKQDTPTPTPNKPANPPKQDSPKQEPAKTYTTYVKTGDAYQPFLWVGIMAAAMAAVGLIVLRSKRKSEE